MRITTIRRPLVAPVQPVVRLQAQLPRPLPPQPKLVPNKEARHSAADTSVYKPQHWEA